MEETSFSESLLQKIEDLQNKLAEAEQLIDAIKAGEVDAFAINSNNQSEIFTLQSGDYAYRALIEKFGEGAINLSEEGLIVYSNPYFSKLTKLPYESIIGSFITDFIDSESIVEFEQLLQLALKGKSKGEINLSINGRLVPVYVSLTSLQPRLPTIGVIITDLTEKKRNELILQEKNLELENTKSFLQVMLDTSIEQIATFDKELKFTSINKKGAEFLKLPKELIIGKSIYDLMPMIRGSRVEQNLIAALNGETIHESKIPSNLYPELFLETYYIPLVIENRVDGVLSITKDISPVVQASTQLEQANMQLAQAQILAQLGSWEWSVEDNNIRWSDEMYRIYGRDKNTFITNLQNFLDCIHPDDQHTVKETINRAVTEKTPINLHHRIIRPDGEERILHALGEILTDANGRVIKMTGTGQDVTESRRDKEKLIKSNEELAQKNRELENTRTFLETVLDSSIELVSTYDVNLNYTSVNKKLEEFLGINRNQIIGKNIFELAPAAKNSELHKAFLKALNGEVVQIQEVSSYARQGVFLETFIIPLIRQEQIEGILVMARDITEIKKASEGLRKANDELEQKNIELLQSNAELASFTYIASHDLQEPLRKIQTFSNRILDKEYQNFPDGIKDYFSRIITASSRMQNLITALLNYSRTNTSDIIFEETDLNSLVEEVKFNLADQIEERNIEIQSEPLPVLKVIPHQFNQLFINIISNAIKYSKPDKGNVIKINADIVPSSELNMDGLMHSKYWKIKIADSGIGFEQHYSDKIFELFQRLHTNSQYEGTGIGLAICKRIVQNHKGHIKASSVPGEGSSFFVYLPLTNSEHV
jgi:PAS domain S-box-containing protein